MKNDRTNGNIYDKVLNALALQKTEHMISRKGLPVIFGFMLAAGFGSCGTGKDPKAVYPQAAVSNLDTRATSGFTALLHNYYQLKDALVQTNSKNADGAATAMLQRIRDIRTLTDSSWVTRDSLLQGLDSIAYNLDKILAVTDESCERKRIYFKPVSETLYDVLRLIQLRHVTIYHTFCPMAFREKGAFWLSEDPEIRNPYFGAKMIECGEVIDTLQ